MAMRVNTNIAALNALRHLNHTEKSTARTLERLASGRKLNRAADGPASLVISEQMKAQISSLGQAISNSETSISMLQTAEGALNEVSSILINLRQLAVHAANEATNDVRMLEADQHEVENLLDTLHRIANNTQFGTRNLLDGSNAVSGVAVGDGMQFVEATEFTKPSPSEGYKVNITQVPTRAMTAALRQLTLDDVQPSKNLSFVVTEDGKSAALSINNNRTLRAQIDNLLQNVMRPDDPMDESEAVRTVQQLIANELQKKIDENNLNVETFIYKPPQNFGELQFDWDEQRDVLNKLAEYPEDLKYLTDQEIMVIRHKDFGSNPTFTVTTTMEDFFNFEAPANKAVSAKPGKDVEGTIGGYPEFGAGQPALGEGQFLTAAPGSDAEGLKIKYTNNTDDVIYEIFNREELQVTGLLLEEKNNEFLVGEDKPGVGMFGDAKAEIDGYVHVNQSALAFQIGPNQGQQVKISINSVRPTQLSKDLDNISGFRSLDDLSVMTNQEAQDSLALIDTAIEEVASLRAELGAFQRNTLESNLNSLRISQENLTASESELGDADMAAEMSTFVRNQILMQSGTAMLAQANQVPKQVLQLLEAGG